MSASQKSINAAIESADITKEIGKAKDQVTVIRDHVFDTINVPFPIVRKVHDHLIDAERSLAAASVALTRSK